MNIWYVSCFLLLHRCFSLTICKTCRIVKMLNFLVLYLYFFLRYVLSHVKAMLGRNRFMWCLMYLVEASQWLVKTLSKIVPVLQLIHYAIVNRYVRVLLIKFSVFVPWGEMTKGRQGTFDKILNFKHSRRQKKIKLAAGYRSGRLLGKVCKFRRNFERFESSLKPGKEKQMKKHE